jgi:hypothetical protein
MPLPRGPVPSRRWEDLTGIQKFGLVLLALGELVITSVAARDLARRDSSQVRGPKAFWGPVLGFQPLGPLVYLLVGRRGRHVG